MLTRLHVQGMAIIDSLSIEFSPGFNVITGETGAGKSILIRALNFLSGARPSADWVRQGSKMATVTGEFAVPEGHPVLAILDNLGVLHESEAVLVRRQLNDQGRSQAWVNDVVVTTQTLRELGASLLDIFSQHENQRLMLESEHVHYLDQFVEETRFSENVLRLSHECADCLGRLHQTVSDFLGQSKDRDYLEFRLKELKEFGPSLDDFTKSSELCSRAGKMVRSREHISEALSAFQMHEVSVADSVRKISHCLGNLVNKDPSDRMEALRLRAESLSSELDDLNFELTRLYDEFDVDDKELEAAQERLFSYQDLLRKHGAKDVNMLLEQAARLEHEIEFIQDASVIVGKIVSELAEKATALEKSAKSLSKARKTAASKVKARVEGELEELAMKGAAFDVNFLPVQKALPSVDLSPFDSAISEQWAGVAEVLGSVSETGAEKAQFLLSSNPGEPLLPLARIASGGEMSRILLAFKKALVADADTCVLVFDEIDTGVSGRVADVVGRKLAELADSFQVLCISHLPQVAVYSDTHFLVKKATRGSRTESEIVRLTEEESVHEIARLLSGAKVSPTSLANARALREKALGRSKSASGNRRPRLSPT